jgi:hypothetical protein
MRSKWQLKSHYAYTMGVRSKIELIDSYVFLPEWFYDGVDTLLMLNSDKKLFTSNSPVQKKTKKLFVLNF